MNTFGIPTKQPLIRWDYYTKLDHKSELSNYLQFMKVLLDLRWNTAPLSGVVDAVLHWDCWKECSLEPVV